MVSTKIGFQLITIRNVEDHVTLKTGVIAAKTFAKKIKSKIFLKNILHVNVVNLF